jgi:ribosomal protein S17E
MAMGIKNCPKCGKLYSDEVGIVCVKCTKEEADSFEKVRRHIKDNPNMSITEVSEATEVSRKKIIRYIKEGKIEISSGFAEDVQCELCSKPVTTGRYCQECTTKMSSELRNSIAGQMPKPIEIKKTEQGSPRMHTRR